MKTMRFPAPDEIEDKTISIRAFAQSSVQKKKRSSSQSAQRRPPRSSQWVVVFDTETTTDPGQRLRFGTYQVRNGDGLHEAGLFYDQSALTPEELELLSSYATENKLKVIDRDTFADNMFYRYGYWLRGTIVGFNLPFDISRIAIGHSSARKTSAKKSEKRRQSTENARYLNLMKNGFSLKLSNDKRNQRIQVKHLSRKAAIIRFAAPLRSQDARSVRKRNDGVSVRRGFFVDVSTFATAQFARSFTLKSLAEFLEVENRKLATEEHGGPLTRKYIEYAARDAQATWECYQKLLKRYRTFGLEDTPAHKIYSEASLGKAHLKAMNVQRWREVQGDVPPRVLAIIMASYFGGRSEVRIRRELRQVILCDFLSMYPTVCTLMGLWRFVIAKGVTWQDATAKTRAFLERVSMDDLKKKETWKFLHTIVRVSPDWDVFPVRASYDGNGPATIAANHLKSEQSLYFTLADCIASKLLTGVAPKIVEAWTFKPGELQVDLRPIAISGNQKYRVDPLQDDFYKRLIELRHDVKGLRDSSVGDERKALDTEQNALKIAANATSYGIFVEVNVSEETDGDEVMIHTAAGRSYRVNTGKLETPGQFFHPLLATLITGAARLMLAITERLVLDRGLEWAFCDTDSMAIAKPAAMKSEVFYGRVSGIVDWFADLNPYNFGGSILKVEDVNSDAKDGPTRVPLFCWAVSAKRYALFNIDESGQPILRKASAHGLGHLRAPYDADNPAKGIPAPTVGLDKIGVELWQHDIWWQIVAAALSENVNRVNLKFHPALEQPAISRYGATTPKLLRWFDRFNEDRPYGEQVKPFGFLYALFAKKRIEPNEVILETGAKQKKSAARHSQDKYRPVAPYDTDLSKAAKLAFDRENGLSVPSEALRSSSEVLQLYHVHSESKFLNGEGDDRGTTRRRFVRATMFRNIGKEANEWEEQFYLGYDEEEQIDYGLGPKSKRDFIATLRSEIEAVGQREVARQTGVARRTIARLMEGHLPQAKALAKIIRALK
jgi:hypothetical protein